MVKSFVSEHPNLSFVHINQAASAGSDDFKRGYITNGLQRTDPMVVSAQLLHKSLTAPAPPEPIVATAFWDLSDGDAKAIIDTSTKFKNSNNQAPQRQSLDSVINGQQTNNSMEVSPAVPTEVGNPASGPDNLTSGAGHLISVAGDPTSGAGDPTSGAGDPTSGAGDPTSGAGDPTSGAGDPTSGVGDPTSGVGDPTSGVGDPTSGVGDPTSGVGDPTSGVGDPTSGVGDPTSGVGDPTSGAGDPTSGAGNTTSGAGNSTSVVNNSSSATGCLVSVACNSTSGAGYLTTEAGRPSSGASRLSTTAGAASKYQVIVADNSRPAATMRSKQGVSFTVCAPVPAQGSVPPRSTSAKRPLVDRQSPEGQKTPRIVGPQFVLQSNQAECLRENRRLVSENAKLKEKNMELQEKLDLLGSILRDPRKRELLHARLQMHPAIKKN
ncbi:hypothetical protein FHG87_014077 [Trinorchestia longiramus]|nr:hypothetical protein FHG87_014077 [Trinorchestia longiramus]